MVDGFVAAADALDVETWRCLPPTARLGPSGHRELHLQRRLQAVSPATTVRQHGPNNRSTFSLTLHVNVNTTNGSGVLTFLDADDQAAFALAGRAR
jgi:hypothetical protein